MTISAPAEDAPPRTSGRASHSVGSLAAHTVQLYESDEGLVAAVGRFLGEAMAAGEPSFVIARSERHAPICEWLEGEGTDVAVARREGRLTLLDARLLLPEVLIGGSPD